MNADELKNRTKEFAKTVIWLAEDLPNRTAGRVICDQIIRSSTSVAANYRAVCRARSKPDFISKLGIVLEECDETQLWLEMIEETGLLPAERVEPLNTEANELISIFVSSLKTAKGD